VREIRPLRLTWRELETWPGWNCEPTTQSKESGWKPSSCRARASSRPYLRARGAEVPRATHLNPVRSGSQSADSGSLGQPPEWQGQGQFRSTRETFALMVSSASLPAPEPGIADFPKKVVEGLFAHSICAMIFSANAVIVKVGLTARAFGTIEPSTTYSPG
jgi:hypothetical protein